jgi:hypothetical protein
MTQRTPAANAYRQPVLGVACSFRTGDDGSPQSVGREVASVRGALRIRTRYGEYTVTTMRRSEPALYSSGG